MGYQRPAAKIDRVHTFVQVWVFPCRYGGSPITQQLQLFEDLWFERKYFKPVLQRVRKPIMQTFIEDGANSSCFYTVGPFFGRGPGTFLHHASPPFEVRKRNPIQAEDFGYSIVSRIVHSGGPR